MQRGRNTHSESCPTVPAIHCFYGFSPTTQMIFATETLYLVCLKLGSSIPFLGNPPLLTTHCFEQ